MIWMRELHDCCSSSFYNSVWFDRGVNSSHRCCVGVYSELNQQLRNYLAFTSISAFYKKILGRWEEDCEREKRAGMVGSAMKMFVSNRGLCDICSGMGTIVERDDLEWITQLLSSLPQTSSQISMPL